MKRMLALALLASVLLISGAGCAPAPRPGTGEVVLSVSWPATDPAMRSPSEIQTVTAVLTLQSLTVTANLPISGNTASGTVGGLYAGAWVIRVDAATSDGTVIYTGQATVSISTGQTQTTSLTLYAAPGKLDITMDISLLLAQGIQVTGGKVGIYKDPNSGTATYKDMAREDPAGTTIHALVSDLESRTYDAKVVIPAATNTIFTSEYFRFSILPGRITTVFLDADGSVNVNITIIPEPGQVTGLTAIRNGDVVILNWVPVSGVTGYRVYRTDGAGRFRQLAVVDGGDQREYIDDHFGEAQPRDGKVWYAVAALAGDQEGLRSEPVSVTI